jgi:FkbM family methyltransferase
LKKNGKVISIEASKSIFRILKENTAYSNNIDAYNLAISIKNKKLKFYEFPIIYTEYNTVLPIQFNDSSWIENNKPVKIEFEGRKLDSLLEELSLSPNFIKIDVEGAEFKVISGMLMILKNCIDLIISMEYLNDNRQNSEHMKATEFLTNHGYFPHIIEREGNLKSIVDTDIPKHLQNIGLESDNIIFIKQ